MTCTIIPHTRLEDAVDLLARDLESDQSQDPLAVRTLLVQGGTIGRWIATEVAARSQHGIAAGLDFKPVGAFCRNLVAPTGGRDPYALESLVWTIDAALDDTVWLAGLAEGADLRAAVAPLDRPGRHGLAVHLATILDRYQMERPDWIAAWEKKRPVAEVAAVPWLPGLWARIRAVTPGVEPVSQRLLALIRGLEEGGLRPAGCPPRLWVVAPSTLAPLLLRLLTALGAARDPDGNATVVRVLHLVPAAHASLWAALDNERESYDPETTPMDAPLAGAHPLLASLARQAHDLAVLLAEAESTGTRAVDLDALLDLHRQRPPPVTVLAQLQTQIWNAATGPLIRHHPDDRSLMVHCCHSPLREVEILRNVLVEALSGPGAPRPDEVLIAVTDLDTYGPLLSAVLAEGRGNHPGDGFPVRVVGQHAGADPVIAALLALVYLPGRHGTLEEVLAPLEAPAVRRRFGLDEDSLATLRHRLVSAGISWGLDLEQRIAICAYPSAEGTWSRGIDRLLAGLHTGPDAAALDGLLPTGSCLPGEEAAIGGIAVYLDVLRHFAAATRDTAERSVSAWRNLLFDLVRDMTDPQSGTEAQSVAQVRGAIAAIPEQAGHLDLRTICAHLEQMLDVEGAATIWSRGGITVGPMAALRHAPYAVIAVLGLDSTFPRARSISAFDPAARHPRRGDQSQRLDDRQQILDLLLAARGRLHLSWTGCAAVDGSPRAASSTLEELLRYCDRSLHDADGRRLDRHAVLVRQRLHGNDPAYFDGSILPRSQDPFAYAAAKARIARDAGSAAPRVRAFLTAPAAPEIPAALSPGDLLAWMSDPARSFAQEVLRLRFPQHETLPDHEPLVLDPLETWELRDALLAGMLRHQPSDDARLRQDGQIPHGTAGDNTLEDIRAEAAAIGADLDAALKTCQAERSVLNKSWRIAVAVPGDGLPQLIVGDLASCDGRIAVRCHSGSFKGRHLLMAWVQHQLANAQARAVGQPGLTTVVVGKRPPKKASEDLLKTSALRFDPTSASAEAWADIATALRSCWRQPLPIFPDLAAECWDWKVSAIKPDASEPHITAWNQGADEDDEVFRRSELATPKAWTRLVWRGVADPTADWGWFIEHCWTPAVNAATTIPLPLNKAP